MVAMIDERFLTVGEVADTLRVSNFTVLGWLRTGRLRGYQFGGRKSGWRISQADLERFIRESAARSGEGESAGEGEGA